jgi:phosphoserine phosphatase RsbU/P
MLRQAFCGTCMRTIYRGPDEDDQCPVCSADLIVTAKDLDITIVSPGPARIITEDERLRLGAVRRYEILDTPPDESLDRITRIAARVFDVPVATITIVDEDRIWFKSKFGMDADQIPRDPGLCASAILDHGPFVVNDASKDPRTIENPLVRDGFGLRFYAAAPLTTADGYNLGTMNIIDREPRVLRDDEIEVLQELAALVVDQLELRLAAARVQRDAATGDVNVSA